MTRRGVLAWGAVGGSGGALAAAGCSWRPGLPAPAQPAKRVPRVGLFAGAETVGTRAFRDGLRDLGYVDGQHIDIAARFFLDLLPEQRKAAAIELVSQPVDVLVAVAIETAGFTYAELMRLAGTIPVVCPTISFEVVGTGVVQSLARPGGNLTGIVSNAPTLNAKQLELLKGVLPAISRVAVVRAEGGGGDPFGWTETQAAAALLGMQVRLLSLPDADQLPQALATAAQWGAGALLILAGAQFFTRRPWLAEVVASFGLPAMYPEAVYVADGGWKAYGINGPDRFRRVATHVDKILKGAKPADLPVELPTKYDLAVNLKTAQALGITIPQAVLVQATEIVR